MAAQDEELKLRITAEDGTAQALRSISTNFVRQQAELQRGVKTLADGTKIQLDTIQKVADKTGIPFKAIMGQIDDLAKKAANAGTTIGKVGNTSGGFFSGMASKIGPANVALATMATRFLGVGSAIEVARRGIVGWSAFDTQLRLIQNQTDMTTPAVHGLGQEIRRVAKMTGDSADDMIAAFNELREAANLSPEETMKALPGIALAAKGMGAAAKTAASVTGDVMRNMNVPLEQSGLIMEANSHAARAYGLDLNKLEPHMDKLTESARAAGYEGADGYQRLIVMVGIAKMSLKDAGQAAASVQRILENMKSEQMGKALGFANAKRYENWLKQQPDQIGAVIHQMTLMEDQSELMRIAGVKDAGVWRNLLAAWTAEYGTRLSVMQKARGALERGKNMTDGPEAAINRLNESVSHLVQTIGLLWDTLGGNAILNTFADAVSATAEDVQKLIESLSWIIGLGDRPKWLAKSWGEVWSNIKNFSLPKGENSKAIDQMVPNKNLGGGGSAGTGGGGGGLPTQVQKMSLAIKDTNESLSSFVETLDKKEGALMRASLYGSSTDSAVLKASYSPSGGGFIAGGPPGTGGTGGPAGGSPAFPNAAGPPGSNGTGYSPTGTMPSRGVTGPGTEAPQGDNGPPNPYGNQGGNAGITAPAGTPIQHRGMTTITSGSGRKFQVDARYAENFKGFIKDYEAAGGVLGPDTGTLGHRPHNASGHPIGAAIDINQIGYGIRSRAGRGKTLDTATEDALAEKWGLVSGNRWKRRDTGHFGIRSPQAAQEAILRQQNAPGAPPTAAAAPAAPAGPAASGGSQSDAYAAARAAAVAAGIPDPDTAAAIAMHESGNFKRGTGSVFDKSGGTNPFGQTVPAGTPGAVKGRDGQWHASYGSLQEGFEAHYKRWGSHYRRGGTPDQILGSMVGAGYNSVDPNWRSKISGIRARNAGRAAATPAPAPAPAAAVPSNVSEPNTGQPLPSGRLPTEHEARINLNVNDTQVQFARASMRRGADREVREARWNSYSDIGAA